MFTGIISKTALIEDTKKVRGNLQVRLSLPRSWKVKEGESISVNGICSTVKNVSKTAVNLEYMPETIRKSTVRFWKKNSAVNLERSLRADSTLDGHLVTGHVDSVARIGVIVNDGGARMFKIEVPKALISLIATKGSVALDGVSLTVVDVGDDWFAVSLIPYTLTHTTFQEREVGDKVNIEVDILAKYVTRFLSVTKGTEVSVKIKKNAKESKKTTKKRR